MQLSYFHFASFAFAIFIEVHLPLQSSTGNIGQLKNQTTLMKEFGLLLSDRSAQRKLCCKRPLNAVYKDDLQPELFQDVRRSRAIKAIDVKLNSLGTGLEPVSSEHD